MLNNSPASRKIWDTRYLSSLLNDIFQREMGIPMNTSSYRQCIEAIRKELVEKPLRTLASNAFDKQASHSTRVSDLHYGLNGEELADCPSRKMWEYYIASTLWNQFIGLEEEEESSSIPSGNLPPKSPEQTMNTSCTQNTHSQHNSKMLKRGYHSEEDISLGSHSRKSLKLEEKDFHSTIQLVSDLPTRKALAKLHGPCAKFKSKEQALAVSQILRGDSPLIVILGTGAGKTDTWMIPLLRPQSAITVVIAPLIALTEDIARRSKQAGISTFTQREFDKHHNPNYNLDIESPPFPQGTKGIILLTTDSAIKDTFINYICQYIP